MQPGILEALMALAQADPAQRSLRITADRRLHQLIHLSAALGKRGFVAGQKLVGRLLKRLNFSLQANCKTREGANHPDRNAQFEHINTKVKAFQAAGQPLTSIRKLGITSSGQESLTGDGLARTRAHCAVSGA
jgi:hypothetical protein